MNVYHQECSSAQDWEDISSTSDDMDSDYKPESGCSGTESESDYDMDQVCSRETQGKNEINPSPERNNKQIHSHLSDSDIEEYVSDSESLSDDCSVTTKLIQWRIPSQKDICHDQNNKNIYVRKVLKSEYDAHGQKKKRMTVWNQVHCCKYCKRIVTNIAKHLRKHSKEHDVKEVLRMSTKLGARNKQVMAKWDILRNEGDHMCNKKTLKKGEGEMILGRRHLKPTFKVDEYGPCPGCRVWIKLDRTMRLHQKVCPAIILGISEKSQIGGKEIRILSLCEAGKINEEASRGLKEEVFLIMKNDEISRTAQNDSLIVSLGNMWLLKNIGNKLKRKYYTSQRMRDAARLLMNLKQQTHTDKNLYHYLTPEFFNDVVKAALTTASPEFDDEEDLKSPSTAIKIGYDIKRMTGAKWALCLKSGAKEEVDKCNDFLKLMQLEWSLKVSKIALVTLQTRRFNAVRSLPVPDDLVKLQDHVKTELTNQQLEPETAHPETYRRAVELCETRLLLYNKRRSGEIEAITVKQYMKRQCGVSEIDRSMRTHLSKLEVHLLENQELVETRGKGGRGVPVIVPKDTKRALLFISNASVRREAGIRPDNVYLFPNTKLGAVRAYDSLKKICKELKLKQPEQITSVNMRKYTATISQIFDLSMQEQQWLMNHLGHSLDIHKIHYRQTSGVIERVDIAKLMLLQEFNVAGKYAGKKLGDIDLQELVFGSEADMSADTIEVETEEGDETAPLNGISEDEVQPDVHTVDTYDEYQFQDDDSPDEPTKPKRKTQTELRKKLGECISIKLIVKVRPRIFIPNEKKIVHLESICSLVNPLRQFKALSSLPSSPLCGDLLYPTGNMTYCDTAPSIVPGLQDEYNQSQLRAISTAGKIACLPREHARVCLLQGPPGTGKSHTIVGIVKHLVKISSGRCRICLCAPSNAAIDELLGRLIKHNRTGKSLPIHLVRLGKKNSVRSDVQPYCLNNLIQKNVHIAMREEMLKQLPQSLQGERKALENKISMVTKNIENALDQFQRQKLRKDLMTLQKQKEVLEMKYVMPKKKVDPKDEKKAKSNILLKAHVIAGTLSSIGSNVLQTEFQAKSGLSFQVVIVDEATQAIELETLIPLQYGVTKLILVGDPEQLPATVLSQVATENKFNMSLFERLDSHFRYTPVNPVILLDTQYRMDPEISAFPNKYIYNGRIKDDRCVLERSQSPLVPYLLFDVSEGIELFSQGTRSMSNPLEAIFTAELCKFIVTKSTVQERVIGIIAPYANQKSEILNELQKRGLHEIEVSTVDGFQGREKHVIVMSCVRANTSGTVGFVGNRNRMNVSLTRAKYAMYLVGHFEALEASDEWKALLADAKQRCKIVPVSKVSMKQAIRKVLKEQNRDTHKKK